MMSIAQYDNLLRFDNVINITYLVELIMKESESKNYDMILFKKGKILEKNIKKIIWAKIFMKHWVFDYFCDFMPYTCAIETDFISRIKILEN